MPIEFSWITATPFKSNGTPGPANYGFKRAITSANFSSSAYARAVLPFCESKQRGQKINNSFILYLIASGALMSHNAHEP